MSFPNIQSAAPVAPTPAAGGDVATPVAGAPVEADDGFTPEERRKN